MIWPFLHPHTHQPRSFCLVCCPGHQAGLQESSTGLTRTFACPDLSLDACAQSPVLLTVQACRIAPPKREACSCTHLPLSLNPMSAAQRLAISFASGPLQ